jgi:hypothetical protein
MVTIGKRLIPLGHIALLEPFDPSAHPGMKTDKAFKARVVLIDRQSVLTEDTVEVFATAYGFRMLASEGVAVSPSVRFGVETFVPAEGFEPNKPYKSRLSWRDRDGNTQSKLLLSAPESVLAIAVTGKPEGDAGGSKPRGGGGSRKPTAASDRRKARHRASEPAPV